MKTLATVRLKRAYDAPETGDGVRVLVDRLWARGVSKEAVGLDAWMKELGPSNELRRWFGHRQDRWNDFVEKYRRELLSPIRQMLLAELQGLFSESDLTLVYGARDTKENEAAVLHRYLLADKAHPDSGWDSASKVLITASAVADANHQAIASESKLRLFARHLLTEQELGDAIKQLVTAGNLRELQTGWELTTRGRQRVRQLSIADSKGEPSS